MIRQQIFHSFIRDAKASVVYDGTVIGYLGEVHPTVAANYAIKERVYIAVVDMPEIVSVHHLITNMKELQTSRFLQEIYLWLFQRIFLLEILKKSSMKKGGAYLESYELFDVYEGEQIEKKDSSLLHIL